MIDEKKTLDSDSIRNNKKLETLINLRLDYKIPLLILLTHSDNYCDEVKKTEKDWKNICKNAFDQNKKNLLDYLNEQIKKKKSDFIMNENDIIHIVLEESEKMTEGEIIKSLPEANREIYEKVDENTKKILLKFYMDGIKSKENEVRDFIEKEIHVLGQKELLEKIKEYLPSQYHNALVTIK